MAIELGIDGISAGEIVGYGGAATVYSATQERLGRTVAVKVLNVRVTQADESSRRNYEREQFTLGRLSDRQGFVPLYETGFTDDDRPYLIMPFYAAGSLQDRLDRDGPMAWTEAVDTMLQVGRAVQLAHDEGVLHRDIKPANIMVTPDDVPVIADFGIARVINSTTDLQSRTSTTPAFAAPEVFSGATPTVAIDVYGLGMTLYALVNGTPAYLTVGGDGNVLALMRRIELDPVPDLRDLGVPGEVADVVMRSLAKDPDDRQQTAGIWTEQLAAARTTSVAPTEVPTSDRGAGVALAPAPEPEHAPEQEAEPEPDSEPEPEQEAEPEPDSEPEHAHEAEPEPDSEAEPEPGTPTGTDEDARENVPQPDDRPAEPPTDTADSSPVPSLPPPVARPGAASRPSDATDRRPTGGQPAAARSISEPPATPTAGRPTAPPTTPAPDVDPARRDIPRSAPEPDRSDRRRRIAIAAAIGLVLVAIVSIAILGNRDPDSDDVAEPARTGVDEDLPAASEPADESAATVDEDSSDVGVATDFEGAEILITGAESTEAGVAAINGALDVLEERVNLDIEYVGDFDWEANLNTQVEGGNPPDLAIFPQPRQLADFARAGLVVPLSAEVVATTDEFWHPTFQAEGIVDGTLFGVPVRTDLKSLVWYQPGRFAEAAYEVPQTFDEFVALVETIAAAGEGKPLCVGIESGQATGWVFTDWVEDMVLRQHGGDVYDRWVSNEIPFDDPRIIESMQTVVDLWSEDNVFASGGSITSTSWADNAIPLLDGDCWMHHQAHFFDAWFPEGTSFADESDPNTVDTFLFPDINGDRPVLTSGNFVAAFKDTPATMAVAEFMATAEYAETRQLIQSAELGGAPSFFLSAAQGQDPSVYHPLHRSHIEILTTTEFSRFDGSDLMPVAVGAGTFWSEGTALVSGEITAAQAAANIQASWPS